MKNRLLSLLLIMFSAGNCFAALPLQITQIIQQPEICIPNTADFDPGSLTFIIAGGTAPYFYTVNNTGPFPILDNPFVYIDSQGTYSFVISDSAGASVVAVASIEPAQPVQIRSIAVQNINCGFPGSITVTTEGGTPPVQFSVNNGPLTNANIFQVIQPGFYTIRAQSNDSCPPVTDVVQVVATPGITAVVPEFSNVTCNGGSDGSITITQVIGGTPPFEYSINGGITFQTSPTFSNLVAGSYTVIVKDANDCSVPVGPIVISQPDALVITLVPTNPTGNGLSNGSIEVVPNPAIPDIFYTINGGNPQTSPLFTGLPAGTYTIRAESPTTSGGCALATVTLVAPEVLDFTTRILLQPSCSPGPLGSFVVTATGGVPAYQYSINNGVTFQSSPIFSDLVAGVYTVVVKDAQNNTATHQVSVGTLIQPTGNPVTDFLIRKFCQRCIAFVR